MALRDEISEYPYTGIVRRKVEGQGDEDDVDVVIYEGVMDEHMATDDDGHTLQTASYVISMPLTKDDKGNYIVPRKGDEISLVRYGETLGFVVDNAEPSQLGGISVYSTRKAW
jgi:hypothetical protein